MICAASEAMSMTYKMVKDKELGKTVYYYMENKGGSSCGPVNPSGDD